MALIPDGVHNSVKPAFSVESF